MQHTKTPLQSKTIWFNLVISLLAALFAALVQNFEVLKALLSPQNYLLITTFITSVNVWLRFKTSQPIAKR